MPDRLPDESVSALPHARMVANRLVAPRTSMMNPGTSGSSAARWFDEFAMCTTLLDQRYREELKDQLDRAQRLFSARASSDSGQKLIAAAARRAVAQIDRRVLGWIPDSREDRPVLVHVHTVCGRLLSTLPDQPRLH